MCAPDHHTTNTPRDYFVSPPPMRAVLQETLPAKGPGYLVKALDADQALRVAKGYRAGQVWASDLGVEVLR